MLSSLRLSARIASSRPTAFKPARDDRGAGFGRESGNQLRKDQHSGSLPLPDFLSSKFITLDDLVSGDNLDIMHSGKGAGLSFSSSS